MNKIVDDSHAKVLIETESFCNEYAQIYYLEITGGTNFLKKFISLVVSCNHEIGQFKVLLPRIYPRHF